MTQGGGFTLFFFITEGGNCENKIFDILAEPNENETRVYYSGNRSFIHLTTDRL